eukprot:318020-Alexandrium_andersonii.AAC.1
MGRRRPLQSTASSFEWLRGPTLRGGRSPPPPALPQARTPSRALDALFGRASGWLVASPGRGAQ